MSRRLAGLCAAAVVISVALAVAPAAAARSASWLPGTPGNSGPSAGMAPALDMVRRTYLPLIHAPSCPCCSAPVLLAPADGATVNTLIPEFRWDSQSNAQALSGIWELAGDAGFSQLAGQASSAGWAQGPSQMWQESYNLEPATTYWWRACAYCTNGRGPCSPARTFTTAATGTIPSAPVLQEPENGSLIRAAAATLRWSAVNGAVQYRVNWQRMGAPTRSSQWVSEAEVTLSGLLVDSIYQWWVVPRSDYALGSASETWEFTLMAPQMPRRPLGSGRP
jgi:hypothetical protein